VDQAALSSELAELRGELERLRLDVARTTTLRRQLDAAHQQLDGPIVVVWDNLNAHVSARMRRYVAGRAWSRVFQLPPYAPELNPTEGVWSHLKRGLTNLTSRSIDEVASLVKTRLKRMQYRPTLLTGITTHTGLDFNRPNTSP